jgi:hypothetical protein
MMFFESFFDCGADPAAADMMATFFGPRQVDRAVRRAVLACWMALPKDRRNPDELEKQVRRLVDRALRDFREDREAFGRPA